MNAIAPPRWDVFCHVVDNYGDIGVAWRLARQLAAEHGLAVRLWVDDRASFARLRPEIDPGRDAQTLEGVTIRVWPADFPAVEPGDVADVVIEAFACHLPPPYLAAMATRPVQPVWLNLEYLSAEDWVSGCHALPSPHPQLPLTKHFFFPGFTSGTGGLLCEAGLDAARRAFQTSAAAQAAFWARLGVVVRPDETRLSLFAYETPAFADLLALWCASETPLRLLLPVGPLWPVLAGFFPGQTLAPGRCLRHGQFEIDLLPWLAQDDYDRLLWACDGNFVRGEDSFVRAQWAARPLVWQAYRQPEEAQRAKIDAFLARYGAGLPAEVNADLGRFWRAWNGAGDVAAAWPDFWRRRDALARHAGCWSAELRGLGDLAANLVDFCRKKSV